MDAGQQIGVRLARRDETALEDAYAAYGPSVLAYLRRYVGVDDAEDVLQRTFLDVWRSAGRYDQSQRFTGWLFTIAHRRAVDALRAREHAVVDVDSLRQLTGEDGRETVDRFADAADVRQALERLPEHERETLWLAYFEDLTQAEIARRTDAPLGTVKARSSRGLHRLAGLIRQREEEGWWRVVDQHDHPDLAGLLRGELANAATVRAGDHLAGCEACRTRLAETAVGHALMTRAAGVLRDPEAASPARPGESSPALPALPRRRAGHRLALVVAAAALVLVAGVLAMIRPWAGNEVAPPQAADRSAPFEPVVGSGSGRVSMTDLDEASTRMVVEIRGLPRLRAGEYYYVWLLDPVTNKMLPLGQVGTTGEVSFRLSPALVAAYSAVDVSLETDDGDPEHSPTSVLRASYA